MRKSIRIIAFFLFMAMLFSCGKKSSDETKIVSRYEYGLNKTFHSEQSVTYSMLYSDNEGYPYKENWAFWKELEKMTNVKFDLTIIPRADYDAKKSLLINAGQAPYIIPKVYEETAFVNGGAILPISDWVQYMPNYMEFVTQHSMQEDLATITQSDGKYYRLPGMWEEALSEQSIVIRKDVFEKAGVNITALEKNLTWEGLYEAFKKVAAANPGKIVYSDRWNGELTLKLAAIAYGSNAGWGKANVMRFNRTTNRYEFSPITQDYHDFLTLFAKMTKEGLLDKESFTQTDDQALQKLYTGKSFAISANRSTFPEMNNYMKRNIGEGNYELYILVTPGTQGNYWLSENLRLENGIMISTNALKHLGEEGLIKMLRFIDWLWYSEAGLTFSKWGVEGLTYSLDANGKKNLLRGITFAGINNTPEAKGLHIEFGFSNGVFMYGGSQELMVSMFDPALVSFFDRLYSYRTKRPLDPPVPASEDETEKINLIRTPLVDYVATATLQFITGQRSLVTDWNVFVKNCNDKGAQKLAEIYNSILDRSKQK